MSEHELRISLFPGAATPEGQARIQRELGARNEVDYRAFQMLRRLNDEHCLGYEALRRTLDFFGDSDAEATATEMAEEIEEILRDRRLADHKVLAAIAGRPE